VQLQKEIDISSDVVQQQYRDWSALLQSLYMKKSPRKPINHY
jgi:hypothetical protein